jgi:hypothetical protein
MVKPFTIFIIFSFQLLAFGQIDASNSKIFMAETKSGLLRNYYLESDNPYLLYQIKLIPDTFLCARFHTKPSYHLGTDHLTGYLNDLDCPSYFSEDYKTQIFPETKGILKASFEIDSNGTAIDTKIIETPNSIIDKQLKEKIKKLKKFTVSEYNGSKLQTKLIVQRRFSCPSKTRILVSD